MIEKILIGRRAIQVRNPLLHFTITMRGKFAIVGNLAWLRALYQRVVFGNSSQRLVTKNSLQSPPYVTTDHLPKITLRYDAFPPLHRQLRLPPISRAESPADHAPTSARGQWRYATSTHVAFSPPAKVLSFFFPPLFLMPDAVRRTNERTVPTRGEAELRREGGREGRPNGR